LLDYVLEAIILKAVAYCITFKIFKKVLSAF